MDVDKSCKGELTMPRPRSKRTRRPHSKEDTGLGARLRVLRKERGLSQVELAERMGLNQQMVSFYEKGIVRIPARELIKMAGILRASLKEFVSSNGEATNGAKSRKVLKLVERIESLPPREQKAVLLVLEGVLSRHSAVPERMAA